MRKYAILRIRGDLFPASTVSYQSLHYLRVVKCTAMQPDMIP